MNRNEFDFDNTPAGDRVVFEPEVMHSAAGYYIGQYCAEYMLDQWVLFPYDRLTEYMTKKDAEDVFIWYFTDEEEFA